MGNVVPIVSEATRNEPEPPRRWLQNGSCVLSYVVLLLGCSVAVFTLAVLVLGLACGGAFLSMGADAAYVGRPPNVAGIVPLGALPLATRAAYAATLILDTAPGLFVLAELRALLCFYAGGSAFGPAHGRKVRQISMGLAAYAVAPLLGRALVFAAGHGVDTAWFHVSALHALVLAAVLWLVAEVMDAGHEAEQDRGGFV